MESTSKIGPAISAAPLDARFARIVAVDCFPIKLPLRKPLVMSTYRLDDAPILYVRMRSHGGAEGWGEAAASPIMAGETLAGMVAAVRDVLAPRLLGKSVFDRARLSRELRTATYANGGAIAALDMAMLDVAGVLRNVPAVDLLGGALRRSARALWLVGGNGKVAQDVQDAVDLRAQGFDAFKLKVGVGSLENDIRAVRELRAGLGDACFIAADANMGLSVPTATRFVRSTEPYGLAFLEQPLPPGDLARLAAIAAASPIPLCADESIHGAYDILSHVAARAIGGASLKTIKLGGISPLVALAGTCDAIGLSINLAMMMETSLATAAMIHAACAIPNVDWGLSLGSLWLAEDPVIEPIACRDGRALCPEAPGLGVQVEEKRLAAFAC